MIIVQKNVRDAEVKLVSNATAIKTVWNVKMDHFCSMEAVVQPVRTDFIQAMSTTASTARNYAQFVILQMNVQLVKTMQNFKVPNVFLIVLMGKSC